MSTAERELRRRFLLHAAAEVSACHEEARGRGVREPVVFLVDLEDPVGQRLAQHYGLCDPISTIALPADEALAWLGGAQAPLEIVQALQAKEPTIMVVLLLWNDVSVHTVPLT